MPVFRLAPPLARTVSTVLVVLLIVLNLSSPARVVKADTFTVNTTEDGNDPSGCTRGAVCTLRAAITAANQRTGADTINLTGGVYQLSIPGANESENATGDLDPRGVLRLIGSGAERTVIDANDLDRVLDVRANARVEIVGITLRDGRTPAGDANAMSGGGIANAGTLTLISSAVRSNRTNAVANGGAGGGIANRGTLTLVRSVVVNNLTGTGVDNPIGNGGNGGDGGGIYNTGQLIISDSLIGSNHTGGGGDATNLDVRVNGGAGGSGGGVFNTGHLTASASRFTDNRTGDGGTTISTRRRPIGGTGGAGGAIASYTTTLTISDSLLRGNETGAGGAAPPVGAQPGFGGDGGGLALRSSNALIIPGEAQVVRSAIAGNRTGRAGAGPRSGSSGRGGGVLLELASLHIQDSQVLNNATGAGGAEGYGGDGGGITSFSGGLRLSNTDVRNNRTGSGALRGGAGGGVASWSSNLHITNSSISNNRTGVNAFGGGIVFSNGAFIMRNSAVSGNHSGAGKPQRDGEDAGNGGNGGGIWLGASLVATLTNSTISGNQTGAAGAGAPPDPGPDDPRGGDGAAIYKELEALDPDLISVINFVNNTVSGNSTSAGGIGAIVNNTARLLIANGTIVENTATDVGGVVGEAAGTPDAGSVRLRNTILANNRTPDGALGADCSGVVTSQGYNLVRTPGDCALNGDTTGLITNQDPLLSPLGNHGGPTATHNLLPGSPAIDAGNPNGCRGADGLDLHEDQRQFPRPVDGDRDGQARCDIGAVEYGMQRIYLPTIRIP